MTVFLPEYSAIAVGKTYRACYRLIEGRAWRMVRGTDKLPVICQTASQAVSVAKDRVRQLLNPTLTGGPVDDLGAGEWLSEKQERQERERMAVFGHHRPQRLFSQGREVAVEYRRRT